MSDNAHHRPPRVSTTRFSRALRQRLLFLAGGNLLLLAFILVCTQSRADASFVDELARFGPNVAPRVLAGLGLTGIIFAGAIDLSIGSILVVAGTAFGVLFHHGAEPWACFAGCYLTAVVLSAYNGLLIRWLGISPIIVTLAGLTFYRGLALVAANAAIPNFGGSIDISDAAYHVPAREWASWILLAGLAVGLIYDVYGKLPRLWLAVGCSPDACRTQGLDAARIRLSAFLVGGLFLGLAALVDTTDKQVIDPARMARGFELYVVGAVVLGGTNIFGGEGSLLGTALGASFLYLVGQSLLYAGASEYWRQAIEGTFIIGVIGFDCALHRKTKRLQELV